MYAAAFCHTDALRTLIGKGADIHAADKVYEIWIIVSEVDCVLEANNRSNKGCLKLKSLETR